MALFLSNGYAQIGIGQLTKDAALDPPGLVAVAVAHAFALFVGVAVAANISGGHLNPAVTLGLAIGGNITILTGVLYWVFQLLGSIVACLLLKFVTGKVFLPNKSINGAFFSLMFELIITKLYGILNYLVLNFGRAFQPMDWLQGWVQLRV